MQPANVTPDDTPSHTNSSKEVPSSAVLRSLQVNVGPDGEETRAQTVQKSPEFLSSSESPSLLQDLQQSDSTSFILLNLTRAGLGSSAEHLVFVQDEAEDSGNDFLCSESTGSSIPWFLRVQELAHDSLIAATHAQLAKNAKTSSNGENVHLGSGDGQPKDSGSLPQVEKKLKCTVEGCDRTFLWPAHFKYHLKTHRNDRSFICPAEGCGKSFYVLQRLKVHMRTHNGEKPFMCPESSCGKQFTTAGNLKNHLRIHTGEEPFLCEAQRCGRSFAEYSSLRKHLVVHSGEKPHQCQVCGKTFSQSGNRNVHMRKHHLQIGAAGSQEQEQTAEPLMGSSLLEEASVPSKNLVSMNSQPSLGGETLNLPKTNSVLGVDEVLAEGSPRPLSSVPDVTHHLVTMQSGRQSYEGSVLTAVNPQELLNQGDLTEGRTRSWVLIPGKAALSDSRAPIVGTDYIRLNIGQIQNETLLLPLVIIPAYKMNVGRLFFKLPSDPEKERNSECGRLGNYLPVLPLQNLRMNCPKSEFGLCVG